MKNSTSFLLIAVMASVAVGSHLTAATVPDASTVLSPGTLPSAAVASSRSIDITRDWPCWRGSHHNGIAFAQQTVPLVWSETENIAWSVPIPGRGHGAAIVVGDQVVVPTADAARQVESILCFDRTSGRQLWETVVHQGGLPTKMNEKASLASSTVACDGDRFFINFLNHGAAWTSALSRSGELLWQTRITDYVIHQGYGSSPFVYQDLVIVSADNKGESGGAVAGLNRETGAVVWKHARPKKPNYSSPVVVHVHGTDQLIMTGCDLVTSLNPLSGDVNWEMEGATTECVTTTVTDGTHIFTSGGYPKNHVAAVLADGSKTVVWENPTRVYVPSLLCREQYLYAVLDAGIAMCINSHTGEEVWKSRLAGTFSASPVMVGDHIFATNEAGQTFIFLATPEKFEQVGRNQLGDNVFATPTICGGRIYLRAARTIDGKRQEFLYCIAQMQ